MFSLRDVKFMHPPSAESVKCGFLALFWSLNRKRAFKCEILISETVKTEKSKKSISLRNEQQLNMN